MQPSWQPDPTGQHHYRWWDGVGWSDQVADHGVVTIDSAGPGRTGRRGDRPGPAGGRRPNSRLVPAVAAIGVAVVVTGVFVALLRDRAAGGFGTSEAELARRGVYSIELELEAAQAVRVRVEPRSEDLDVQLAVVVDRSVARRAATTLIAEDAAALVEDYPALTDPSELDPDEVRSVLFGDAGDFFTDGDAAEAFGRDYTVVSSDTAFAGGFEVGAFVAHARGTYRIVVGALKGSGSIRIVAERADEPVVGAGPAGREPATTDPFFTDEAFFSDDGIYRSGD